MGRETNIQKKFIIIIIMMHIVFFMWVDMNFEKKFKYSKN